MEVDLSEFYPESKKKCAITRFIENDILGDERETILAALEEPTISDYAVVRWFKARGITTAPLTVSSHRKKRCRCEA